MRLAPKRIIANFKSLLDVKVIPDFKSFYVSIIVFKNIPINKAMTDPPIKCFGRILSINCAIEAITRAKARPGKYDIIFFVFLLFTNKKSVKKR